MSDRSECISRSCSVNHPPARASIVLDNLEQSTTYVELAVASAKTLGSRLQHNESYDIFQHMQKKWPNEKQVKALAELF